MFWKIDNHEIFEIYVCSLKQTVLNNTTTTNVKVLQLVCFKGPMCTDTTDGFPVKKNPRLRNFIRKLEPLEHKEQTCILFLNISFHILNITSVHVTLYVFSLAVSSQVALTTSRVWSIFYRISLQFSHSQFPPRTCASHTSETDHCILLLIQHHTAAEHIWKRPFCAYFWLLFCLKDLNQPGWINAFLSTQGQIWSLWLPTTESCSTHSLRPPWQVPCLSCQLL